jgi:hypothetical protein
MFLGLVWLSVAALAVAVIITKAPKRRKPVDELEATDAALRNRIIDLEDKLEHHIKREAVRIGRDKRESATPDMFSGTDPLSARREALSALRTRVAGQRGII